MSDSVRADDVLAMLRRDPHLLGVALATGFFAFGLVALAAVNADYLVLAPYSAVVLLWLMAHDGPAQRDATWAVASAHCGWFLLRHFTLMLPGIWLVGALARTLPD